MSTSVVQQAVVPVSPQVQTVPGISYRSLQPGDFDVLKVIVFASKPALSSSRHLLLLLLEQLLN
jgi:hypothetical protein